MAETGVRKPDSDALDSFVENGVSAASALMAWKGAHSNEPSELEEETKVSADRPPPWRGSVARLVPVLSGGM